jgi:hypothetical protein
MKTAVSNEADEKNRCQTEWPDGATRVARDTHWASRADGHPDGCPTEDGWAPVGGEQVPDGRRTSARRRAGVAQRRAGWVPNGGQVLEGGPTAGLGGGPMEDYISAIGPHFWALSSSAQSYLQEMRVRRVLMSKSVL